jgi:Phospholipase_D-nuclease N-terminal
MNGIWLGVAVGAVRLPAAAIAVLAVLGAAQIALFIWALVDLVRRPRPALLPRWGWLVVIILFELLGPIFYLALGRGEPPVTDTAPLGGGGIGGSAELDESRTQRAVDMLYGPSPQAQPPGDAGSADAHQGSTGQGTTGGA